MDYMRAVRQLILDQIAGVPPTTPPSLGWIVSQQPPGDAAPFAPFPDTRWAFKIDPAIYPTGQDLANAITITLQDRPNRVIIDELSSPYQTKVYECAYIMRTVYNQYRGRWGCFLIRAGSTQVWASLNGGVGGAAIDELFRAGAIVAWEAYVRKETYCNQGSTVMARDAWLGNYYRDRMNYLVSRRAAVSVESLSYIQPVLGVTDTGPNSIDFLTGANPNRFLDRMFNVWRTQSGYASSLDEVNGGAGSYKWDVDNMTDPVRDDQFRNCWLHYCRSKLSSPTLSAPTCP